MAAGDTGRLVCSFVVILMQKGGRLGDARECDIVIMIWCFYFFLMQKVQENLWKVPVIFQPRLEKWLGILIDKIKVSE